MNAGTAEFILILGLPIGVAGLLYYEYKTKCADQGKGFIECVIGGTAEAAKSAASATLKEGVSTADSVVDSIIPCNAERVFGIGKCGGDLTTAQKALNYTPIGQVIRQSTVAVKALEKAWPHIEKTVVTEAVKLKDDASNLEKKLEIGIQTKGAAVINEAKAVENKVAGGITNAGQAIRADIRAIGKGFSVGAINASHTVTSGFLNKIEHPLENFVDRKKEQMTECKGNAIQKALCKTKVALSF